MKKNLLLLLAVFICGIMQAQVNVGGQPLTFTPNVALPSLKTIPMYTSPALDMVAINAENAQREDKGQLRYFGKLVEANLTLTNSGVWNTLPNGDRVWRLAIKAQDALAVTLYYDEFYMPAGAKMFVFTPDGEEVYGAFTSENNSDLRYFVTAMTHTDECVVEYYEPAAVAGQGIINIGEVAHAYRDVKSRKNALAPTGSGSCNVDVNCSPEGDDWQDEKHSVVTLLTTANANQSFCTGALVNNVRQDCTPYVLTANHCIDNNTTQDYAQMSFYFNNEHTACGSGNQPTQQIVAGSVFKARAGGNSVNLSDFALVQITGTIPAAYNPYFAGWNADVAASPNGVCIHHPSGDLKKISYYTAPLVTTGYGGAGTTHWQANWVATTNGYGITEPGSSGSPLFNNNGQIVGDLSGGPSSCTATNKWDYYGKVAYSWTSCGTAAANQLKPWLDPDNTGILSLNGTYSPCSGILVQASPNAASVCAGNTATITVNVTINGTGGAVTLSATGLPAGVTAAFNPTTLSATGSSVMTITATGAAAAGTSTVSIVGTQGANTSNAAIQLTVTSGTPSAPTLNVPADAATGVATAPTLSWAGSNGATYQVQVATDAAFTNVVATATGLTAASYTVTPALSSATTYYWHVRSTNGCGTSAYSTTFSFTTGTLSCATISGAGLPITIADNTTTTATLTFPGSGTITDVNILSIIGTHSYTSDLTFTLTSPAGTSVVVLDGQCGSNDDFNFGIDDASTTAVICPLTGGNTFTSANPLAAFNGENPQGTWTLTISDNAAQDFGSLTAWSVNICFTGGGSTCLLTASTTVQNACAGGLGSATAVPVNATGASTYLWSNGQTTATATGLAAGTYTVTVTNGNCTASASAVLTAAPAITAGSQVTNATGTACNGAVSTVVTGGVMPYTYTWSNGLTSANIGGLCPGTFTVTITDANGCTVTTSGTVSSNVGTFHIANLNGLSVAPNPTSGVLNLNLSFDHDQVLTIDLFAVNGQLINSQVIECQSIVLPIDLTSQASGVYILRIATTQGTEFVRVTKN